MFTVYYDGNCPLCRREIGFYKRQTGASTIEWRDVADETKNLPAGMCRVAALKRFHVQTSHGKLVSGGAAFAELWSVLPRFRWVGVAARRRPFVWFLEIGYRIFLPLRPFLQKVFG